MRNSTALPTTLTLTKHYYKPHIETIKSEFKDARELSGASAEEWIKGLAQQGQQRIASTIPWEQYEAKGGLKKVNAPPQPKRSTPSAAIAEGKAPTPAIKTEPQLERANSHTLGHQASFGANQRIPIPPKPLESAFISPNAMSEFPCVLCCDRVELLMVIQDHSSPLGTLLIHSQSRRPLDSQSQTISSISRSPNAISARSMKPRLLVVRT